MPGPQRPSLTAFDAEYRALIAEHKELEAEQPPIKTGHGGLAAHQAAIHRPRDQLARLHRSLESRCRPSPTKK